MCASYGLQITPGQASFPVFNEKVQTDLSEWMLANGGETVRPTGINLRNYNPVIVEDQGELTVESGWWQLWPGGKRPTKRFTINARADNLDTTWKGPLTRGRILVPATEYFEWTKTPKQRYSFHLPNHAGFAFAGVAQPITTPEGESMLSYAIVTRNPTEAAATIHDRMPLVLPQSFYGDWLNPAPGDRALADAAVAASTETVEELVFEAVS